jgi:predicted SnoaL-like aldol condensation-catalyzing enzyme
MVDGATLVTDLDETESNRETVQSFVDEVLIRNQLDKLEHYIDGENYSEHNPRIGDVLLALRSALSAHTPDNEKTIRYDRNHRLLAEGNFVLSVSEGFFNGIHSSFYDLFRVANGTIVEHWDTTEAIPPRAEWKNDNGKF